MPTFSVIIPNYNNGATLARAIESVQAQTFRAHEIIVIDDGSSDDSAAVVARFGDQVRYIYQQNAGVAAARNHGVESASGEWLAFLDADDEFTSDRLEAHANWLASEPDLDFLLADQEMRDPQGKMMGTFVAASKSGKKLLAAHPGAQRIPIGAADFEDLLGDGFMEIRTISMPRKTFMEIGGFPTGHKVGEDLHLFARLLARSRKGGLVPRTLAIYHIYPTSALRKNPVQAAEDFLYSIESLHRDLAGAPAAISRGYNAKRHAVRMNLSYAYLRVNRKKDAVLTVMKSLLQFPGLRTLRDVLSIMRGFPKT